MNGYLKKPTENNVENLTSTAEESGAMTDAQAMTLLAFDHTKLEHKLYEIMFDETRKSKTKVGEFSVRYLTERAKAHSHSQIRRARYSLAKKKSIESQKLVRDSHPTIIYTIHSPLEIFEQRRKAGILFEPKRTPLELPDSRLLEAVGKVVERGALSRREAQVSLQCAEGLTNAEIGNRLFIHEETVKFHMHNIFLKLGIRRRTELVAHLYRN